MSQGFQVITSALLNAFVSSNWSVPGGPRQIFAIFIRNMLAFAILVAFGESEINYVDSILRGFSATYKEIVRFNIAMDNALFLHFLNKLY